MSIADRRIEPGYRSPAHDEHGEQPVIGPGLMEGAGELIKALRGVAHDYVVLAGLETKRAGQSLVMMLAAGVMMAILAVSAWLGLVVAGVFALIAAGLAPSLAVLVAVLANLLFAGGLYLLIRYKRRYLAFPAMTRNLQPSTTPEEHRGGLH